MISAASSKRAVVLCLLQSLAGVIFGWSNAEGSGLVSDFQAESKHDLTRCSSRWRLIRGDLESPPELEEHMSSVLPDRVPLLVSWLLVLPLVPLVQVSLRTR